jgi:hypothetical protein
MVFTTTSADNKQDVKKTETTLVSRVDDVETNVEERP